MYYDSKGVLGVSLYTMSSLRTIFVRVSVVLCCRPSYFSLFSLKSFPFPSLLGYVGVTDTLFMVLFHVFV